MTIRDKSRAALTFVLVSTAVVVLAVFDAVRPPDRIEVDSVSSTLDSLRRSGPGRPTIGTEVWMVAVCRIPPEHDLDLYDMSGVRLTETSQWVVEQIAPVSEYFRRWSNGLLRIEFRAAPDDIDVSFGDPNACVDAAVEQGSRDVDGILVVADAQHRESKGGGWGRTSSHCTSTCSAEASPRVVYVGAADFVTGSTVALDLVEHEMGHAFGWPHSRRLFDYDSVLDVMSDSSAAHRVDPTRVHAPGVLAINRYLAGWMSGDPVVVDLGQSVGSTNQLMIDRADFVVLPLSETRMITVEIVAAEGDNSHLRRSGVAVHLIDWGAEACAQPQKVDEWGLVCAGSSRSQRLVAPDPSRDGLMVAGQHVEIAGVKVLVEALDDRGSRSTAAIRLSVL